MHETGPGETFRAFLAQGRFMIQKVVDADRHVFFPRIAEPRTGAALDWVQASGRGVVYATTVVRKKPPEPSYNVALIDLVEGPRLMSRVEGLAPEAVTIGLEVTAAIVEQDGEPVVIFRPADG